MLRYTLGCWLLLSTLAFAQPTISLPEKLDAKPGKFLQVPSTTNGKIVRWFSPDPTLDIFPIEMLRDTTVAVVIPERSCSLFAYTALGDVPSMLAECKIVVGDKPPMPVVIRGCTDPKALNYNPLATEDDGSCKYKDPPTPPDGLPIGGEGFRCLVVYESSSLSTMIETQRQVLNSIEIRNYLYSKVAAVAGMPEYRFLDQDADMSNASKIWQDAMKRKRGLLPWILISNGKEGFEGPLPLTVGDTLLLLKKYGGN